MFNRLRIAISFLTVLPAGCRLDYNPVAITGSAVFFPLVGWLLGGLLAAAAFMALRLGLTPQVAAVLVAAVAVLLTRGLHLDGVADLMDGLGGAFEPVRRLEIMKDSFIGPFGVAGLVFLLVGKIALLTMLLDGCGERWFVPLLTVPAAARWAMVGLAFKSRYPRPAGTGHVFVGKISGRALGIAGLWLLPLFFFGWHAAVMVLGAQVPALWLRYKAHRAFGGVTGDVLGASCEFGELAGWLAGACYLGVMG